MFHRVVWQNMQKAAGFLVTNQFTADLARNLIVRKICQSAKIYGHEFAASLFGPPCTRRHDQKRFACSIYLRAGLFIAHKLN